MEQGNRVAYEVTVHGRPADTPGVKTADATNAHFSAGAFAEIRDKLAYDAFYFDQMAILGQHGQP